MTSSTLPPPPARRRGNARPELVVPSALKPSSSSIRAEPASQGFGIRNGSPSWRARNSELVAGKLVFVGGHRPLVALNVRRACRVVNLAADLFDAEEAAHLVTHVRRQRH